MSAKSKKPQLAATNALGYVTSYEYDATGRQTAVVDALTNRTDSVYDAGGQLRFTTNALKQVTEYQYDAKGRRIKTIFPDNSYTTNSYNEISQLMFVKDQAGLETDYQYDSLGRMTNVSKPLVFNPEGGTNANPQWAYQYDSYGNLLDIRDPKKRETKFNYDAFGQLVSRTLPLLQTNFNAYNALGQLAMAVDFMGQSNRFVYDSLGRVATNFLYAAGATAPGRTNVFIYDANGRLYQTLRPEGITTFQYNLDGAVTNITSPEGAISYEYDPTMGWLTRACTTNSDIRYGYDELSRLKTVSVVKRDHVTLATPEVTTNTYTRLGSLQNVYFPNGTWTVYQYDGMNRLTNLTETSSSGVMLAQYYYKADAAGRRTNAVEILRQENGLYLTNTLTWQHDNLSRLTIEALICSKFSASYTNSYSYDLAGNRLSKVHIGGTSETIAYTYNNNDELSQEVSSISPTATYFYDANGSLTNKTAGTMVNSYAYNLENKLTAVAVNGTTNATYQYNGQGARISSTIGGNTTNYLIDANNLTGYPQILEELPTVGGTPAKSYVVGNEVLAQSASGTLTYFLKDGHDNNRQLTSASGTVSSHYSYDAYGVAATEIMRQVNGTYATNQLAWGCDNLGRLTNEASSSTLTALNFTNKYVYDLAGNRLWKTNVVGAVMTVTSYSYNANDQLLVESTGSVSFTNRYDANGSLTNRSSASEANLYSYNLEGRLATATINQQQTNRYYYNQSGIRTRMEIFGSVSSINIFLNDPQNLTGSSQVLEELPVVGTAPTATYTLGSQIISQEKSGTVLHLLPDGHSSTRSLIDSGGVVQNALTYDGYGNLLASNAAPQTVYLYTGERFDSDIRQYYLRNRYFNPVTGRFVAQDHQDGTPNDPLSLHKYAYCQNNPVNGIDPSGHEELVDLMCTMAIQSGLSSMVMPVVQHGMEALGYKLLPQSVRDGLQTATSFDGFVAGISGSFPVSKYPAIGFGGLEVVMSPKTGKAALYGYGGGGFTARGEKPGVAIYGGIVFNCRDSDDYNGLSFSWSIPYRSFPSAIQNKIDGFLGSGFGGSFGDPDVLQEAKALGIQLGGVLDKTTVNVFFGEKGPASPWGITFGYPVGPLEPAKNATSHTSFTLSWYQQLLPWGKNVPFR